MRGARSSTLKLPMKQRYAEMLPLQADHRRRVCPIPVQYGMLLRQLYHDREEVTGFIERIR